MAGGLLTSASTLQCPHGGAVQIVPTSAIVTAGGSPVSTVSDTFTVTGCIFMIPTGVPSPCVRVQWLVPDTATSSSTSATLSASSTGLCLAASGVPQGPVSVQNTQSTVQVR